MSIAIRICALFAALSLFPAGARADLQTYGAQQWPGPFQAGVHIVGGQAGWTGNEASGYLLSVDFAGRIKDFDKLSIWIGGGFDYTLAFVACSGCGHDLRWWAFAEVSLEKLLKLPLVPYLQAGPAGDLLLYGATGGAFLIRLGGGIHYWPFNFVGFGLETHFDFGVAAFSAGNRFYGAWDLALGARFAFKGISK